MPYAFTSNITVITQFGRYFCDHRLGPSVDGGISFHGTPKSSLDSGIYDAPTKITVNGHFDTIDEVRSIQVDGVAPLHITPRRNLRPAPDAHLEAAYEERTGG